MTSAWRVCNNAIIVQLLHFVILFKKLLAQYSVLLDSMA